MMAFTIGMSLGVIRQCSIVVKSIDFRSRLLESESWFLRLLGV